MLDGSLQDATESLVYWRSRRSRLPWYRRSARREASLMALRWERRVRAAALSRPDLSLGDRLEAARLGFCGPLSRWARRAGLAALAMVALTAMAAGATFALILGQL